MAIKPLAWSYSTWSAFQKCPKQYHEVRVLKKYKVESAAITAGMDQHKAFELALKKKQPLPPHMAHHQPMMNTINQMPGNKFAELQMALDTQGQSCDYFAPNVWVRAVADVLVTHETTAKLMDYKGGKSRYADTAQMKLTSLVIFAKWPNIVRVDSALLFTAENKVIPTTYHRAEEKQYWQQMLVGYGDMMRAHASGNFVAKPSGLCSVCPVQDCAHRKER